MNFSELTKKLQELDESLAPPSGPIMQSECGSMEGCGDGPMPSTSQQQDSVNMTVSMNGSGKGGIRDLIDVLRNIESKVEPEKHHPKGGDEIVVGEPSVLDDIDPVAFEEPSMPPIEEPMIPEFGMTLDEPEYEPEFDDEPEDEFKDEPVMDEIDDDSFANKLDRKTLAISAVLGTGDDLASKGKEAPKPAGGGNPWNINESAVAARLAKHYEEVKSRTSVSEGYYGWDDPRADEPEDDYGYSHGTTEMELKAPYDINVNDEDYNVQAGEEVIFMVDYDANGDSYEVERVYYGGFDNIPEIEIDWNKTPRGWNNSVYDQVGEWLLRQKKQTPYRSPRRQQEPDDYDDYDDPATSFNAMTDYEKRINRDY